MPQISRAVGTASMKLQTDSRKCARSERCSSGLGSGLLTSKRYLPNKKSPRLQCLTRLWRPENRHLSLAISIKSTGVPSAKHGSAQCKRDVITQVADCNDLRKKAYPCGSGAALVTNGPLVAALNPTPTTCRTGSNSISLKKCVLFRVVYVYHTCRCHHAILIRFVFFLLT